MTSRTRRGWKTAFASTAVLTIAAWMLINPRNKDRYLFLKDHPIVDVAVTGPGSWGPSEIRTYSWKGSWKST
ncbi:MAG: hypothetical protein HONBIEJF_01505 [Fimbriimonadaceae bacterium]|nr:hypothetical protein [Fimbriimonadaceae bacterium]